MVVAQRSCTSSSHYVDELQTTALEGGTRGSLYTQEGYTGAYSVTPQQFPQQFPQQSLQQFQNNQNGVYPLENTPFVYTPGVTPEHPRMRFHSNINSPMPYGTSTHEFLSGSKIVVPVEGVIVPEEPPIPPPPTIRPQHFVWKTDTIIDNRPEPMDLSAPRRSLAREPSLLPTVRTRH